MQTGAETISGLSVEIVNARTLFDVGGDIFDLQLAQHLAGRFEKTHGVDLMQDPQVSRSLSLRFKGLFLYAVDILCNVDSSVVLLSYHITSLA